MARMAGEAADKQKSERGGLFILMTALVAAGLFFVYLGNLKEGFYADEIFSYAHANSPIGAYMSEEVDSHLANIGEKLEERWIKGETFSRYLEGDKGEKLAFSHIFFNMGKSVHPPVYYLILHSVSWLFGGEFSKIPGLIVNGAALLLFAVLFYGLAKEVLSSEKWGAAVTGVVLFLPIVLEMEMFIRMYELEMAFMMGLFLWAFRLLDSAGKVRFVNWCGIFIFAVLGCLTHYYGLIYAFFMTVFVGVRLLFERRLGLAFAFGAVMLLSVMAAGALYPVYFKVLFFSQRGEEAYFNLSSFTASGWFVWVDFLIKQFTGGLFGIRGDGAWGCVFFACVLAGGIFFTKKGRSVLTPAALMLGLIAVLGAMVIMFSAPNMGRFNGRYYAISVVLWFLACALVVKQLLLKNRLIYSCIKRMASK